MYRRFLEEKLRNSLKFSPATLVLGGRQSGKTTLVRSLKNQQERSYYSLDNLLTLRSAKESPDQFFKQHTPPLTLDEVQRAPDLFIPMKLEIDENRHNGMFLLTGSANPLTLPNLGDSLAGRMVIYHLWPLSQGELLGKPEKFLETCFMDEFPPLESSLLSFNKLFHKILVGGFPTMQTLENDSERSTWCNSYLQAILDKDVRDLAQIEKLSELPNLLELIATRPGSLLNYTNLSSACNIPRSTLIRYLQYMQTLFTIHLLPPWFTNQGKRLTKSPKVYFNDTGILCHLLGLSSTDLNLSQTLLGSLIENFIVVEIQKQLSWNTPHYKLYFYRDHVGNEIDLTIEGPRKEIVAIEIKSSETVKPENFKVIKKFAKDYPNQFKRGIVLYRGESSLSFGPDLFALPIQSVWR
ncbi:MAG: ATP-binding protein [Chlamydiia bacterium]|nr:ATP-binding protein [Chlamydiia bacterium]